MAKHKASRWPWGIGLDKRQARRLRRRWAANTKACRQEHDVATIIRSWPERKKES